MIGPITGMVVLGVYGVLLAAGGAMGYVKARSRPSLIAGFLAGLWCLATLAYWGGSRDAFRSGAVLAALMLVVFGVRLAKTRKFMPSGLLAISSLVVLAVMALEIL